MTGNTFIRFRPFPLEIGRGTIANPLRTDRPVCLRTLKCERKQETMLIEEHVIRIMCQVIPAKKKAAGP
jgi:hypothetical protein